MKPSREQRSAPSRSVQPHSRCCVRLTVYQKPPEAKVANSRHSSARMGWWRALVQARADVDDESGCRCLTLACKLVLLVVTLQTVTELKLKKLKFQLHSIDHSSRWRQV